MSTVYHAGEIEVQRRAGVRPMAMRVAQGIHDSLIVGAAHFLAEQPMVIVGFTDGEGKVWASVLTGEPGFAHAVGPRTIRLHITPVLGDPLSSLLAGSSGSHTARLELGILIIDLKTRERMRLNGRAEMEPDGTLFVHIREVYFNCPKYIQKREVEKGSGSPETKNAEFFRAEVLTAAQRDWITTADTFFVASAAPDGSADASHRGGNPGFVHIRDASVLEWPDYSGNTMFNTLGNITSNPSTGLLFLDFEHENTLHLTGRASVVWKPERISPFPGAERLVEFHVEQVIQTAHGFPLHFRFLNYSPFNPSITKEKP